MDFSFVQSFLHLSHGNRRQMLYEKEKKKEERAKAPDENSVLDHRGKRDPRHAA
jgi:hypothetical protein